MHNSFCRCGKCGQVDDAIKARLEKLDWLEGLIEEAKVFYGFKVGGFIAWGNKQSTRDTHKCKIIFIEEIKDGPTKKS